MIGVRYTDDYSFDNDTGIDNDVDQLRSDSKVLYNKIAKTYPEDVVIYIQNV